jgi:predicted nucleic acid-binding protein
MDAFFDTSALVPQLLKEPHTGPAKAAWLETTQPWAWHWLRVETESALTRRGADAKAWRKWRELSQEFEWIGLGEERFARLCDFNRTARLRAADAGHLFVCETLTSSVADLTLVTFDAEMCTAAKAMGLTVWEASGGGV